MEKSKKKKYLEKQTKKVYMKNNIIRFKEREKNEEGIILH